MAEERGFKGRRASWCLGGPGSVLRARAEKQQQSGSGSESFLLVLTLRALSVCVMRAPLRALVGVGICAVWR